jgi:hypothetical protein
MHVYGPMAGAKGSGLHVALGVNDDQRMAKAAKGIAGKRLTYRRTRRAEETEAHIPF